MVKTQLEIVEVGKASLFPHRYSLWFALTVEFPRPIQKNDCTLQPLKIGYHDEAHPSIWSQMIYYFIFPTLATFTNGLNNIRLNKIYISTSKYYLSEGYVSPSWRNSIGHLLLDTMADSPVWFKILTNNISSNPRSHMVVPFLLVPLHWQGKCQDRDRKRGHTLIKRLQAQRKT